MVARRRSAIGLTLHPVQRQLEANFPAVALQKSHLVLSALQKTPSQQGTKMFKFIPKCKVRKQWSDEEDRKVLEFVRKYGKNWKRIEFELNGRTSKQIRERYINQLDPDINHGKFTETEDRMIYHLFIKYGPRWSDISKNLKGRPVRKHGEESILFLHQEDLHDGGRRDDRGVSAVEVEGQGGAGGGGGRVGSGGRGGGGRGSGDRGGDKAAEQLVAAAVEAGHDPVVEQHERERVVPAQFGEGGDGLEPGSGGVQPELGEGERGEPADGGGLAGVEQGPVPEEQEQARAELRGGAVRRQEALLLPARASARALRPDELYVLRMNCIQTFLIEDLLLDLDRLTPSHLLLLRTANVLAYRRLCSVFLKFTNHNTLLSIAIVILKVPPHDRTEQEIQIIINATKDLAFFTDLEKRFKNLKLHAKCCACMTYHSYTRGETVFKYGDPSDNFFIVIEGSACIYVPLQVDQESKPKRAFKRLSAPTIQVRKRNFLIRLDSDEKMQVWECLEEFSKKAERRRVSEEAHDFAELKGNGKTIKGGIRVDWLRDKEYFLDEEGNLKHEFIKEVQKGEMFGERGILLVSKRTGSIVAKSDLHVGVMKKKDYIQILKEGELRKINTKVDFICEKLMIDVKRQVVLNNQYMFNKEKYSLGNVIYHEHEQANTLYIIKKGQVKLYKEVKGRRVCLFELGEGNYFGDVEVISKTGRLSTAIVTSEKCSVWGISQQSLFKMFSINLQSRFLIEKSRKRQEMLQGRVEDLARIEKWSRKNKKKEESKRVAKEASEFSLIKNFILGKQNKIRSQVQLMKKYMPQQESRQETSQQFQKDLMEMYRANSQMNKDFRRKINLMPEREQAKLQKNGQESKKYRQQLCQLLQRESVDVKVVLDSRLKRKRGDEVPRHCSQEDKKVCSSTPQQYSHILKRVNSDFTLQEDDSPQKSYCPSSYANMIRRRSQLTEQWSSKTSSAVISSKHNQFRMKPQKEYLMTYYQ